MSVVDRLESKITRQFGDMMAFLSDLTASVCLSVCLKLTFLCVNALRCRAK